MGKGRHIAVFACLVLLLAGQANARNQAANCLTEEAYKLHETQLSPSCFIKADPKTNLIDYYQRPEISSKVTQGKGPWIQIYASELVVAGAHQFLFGFAADYNGNQASLNIKQPNGSFKFQHRAYFLVADATCELKPVGYLSPSQKLEPAELCRIKNK